MPNRVEVTLAEFCAMHGAVRDDRSVGAGDWLLVDANDSRVISRWQDAGAARSALHARFDADESLVDELQLVRVEGGAVVDVEWPSPLTPVERAVALTHSLNRGWAEVLVPGDVDACVREFFLRSRAWSTRPVMNETRHALELWWMTPGTGETTVGLLVQDDTDGFRFFTDWVAAALPPDLVRCRVRDALAAAGVADADRAVPDAAQEPAGQLRSLDRLLTEVAFDVAVRLGHLDSVDVGGRDE